MIKEKEIKLYMTNKSTLLSVSALCLLLFLTIQCGLLANQSHELSAENEALSSALADKEQAVREQTREVTDLQTRLTEAASIEEVDTERGFLKKNGIYLIDTKDQLWELCIYIEGDMEIEPGVPAASASYRLRDDICLTPYQEFCLGTKENPFCGSFDGDGHLVDGAFSLMDGADVPEAMFCADESAKIENLHVFNRMIHIFGLNCPSDCAELESHLPDCESSRVQVRVSTWNLDVQKTAEALRTHWEKTAGTDGAHVSMTFFPDQDEPPADAEAYIQKMHTALCTLAGAEYAEMIEEALTHEKGYLWFVRLEQIEGLICCTFEIGEPDFSPPTYKDDPCSYYIITEGNWRGKPVPLRPLRIPYTDSEMHSIGINTGYHLEPVDFNFDEKPDLLIHEGGSGGSGGSWGNYRALVWNDTTGQFERFSSFPAQVFWLQFDRQRIINRWRTGVSHECIDIYEIVNGEYVCTRSLVTDCKPDGEIQLIYYEMGEPVKTHILSDIDERETLYPDMNYWLQG